jgi:hypothetical protein
LEHATKVIIKTASANKPNTRRAASGNKEGMGNPKNNNDRLVSNLFKPTRAVKRQ